MLFNRLLTANWLPGIKIEKGGNEEIRREREREEGGEGERERM